MRRQSTTSSSYVEPVVLLLDSADADRRMIERMLGRGTGRFQVRHATTHEDAMQMLAEDRIDLVIMDLLLSDLPGFEALVKLTQQHRNVPVIVVTEEVDENLATACRKGGADEVVSKRGIDRYLINRAVDASLASIYRARARDVSSRADHAVEACYQMVSATFDGCGRKLLSDRSPERHAELVEIYKKLLAPALDGSAPDRREAVRTLQRFIDGLARQRGTVADVLHIHNATLDAAINHTSGPTFTSLSTRGHRVAVDVIARFVGAQLKANRTPVGRPGLRTGERASEPVRRQSAPIRRPSAPIRRPSEPIRRHSGTSRRPSGVRRKTDG